MAESMESDPGTSSKTKIFVGNISYRTQIDESRPCLIDSLVDDVLILIFTLLPWKHRIGVERVCKRWKQVMMKAWVKQTSLQFCGVFRQSEDLALTDRNLTSLLLRCGKYLHTLDLSGSPRFLTDFAMDIIGKYCPGIRNLDLSIVNITDRCRQNLVQECHCTSQKSFRSIQNDIDTLRILTLSNTAVSDEILVNILNHCRNIEELIINNCFCLTGQSLQYICTNCRLKVLHTADVKYDLESLLLLKNLELLEDLDISSCHTVNDQVISSIAQGCKKLRNLNISVCHSITDVGIIAVAKIPTLESIDISYLSKLTEGSIQALSENGNLVKFAARVTTFTTDDAISTLFRSCPRLNYLDLRGCFKISNEIFESFKTNTDPDKVIYLRLGGNEWVAEDVDWVSGLTHLNDPMLTTYGMLSHDVPIYKPIQEGPVEFINDWDEDCDEYLDNDDPLEDERWNMS